MVNGGFGGGGLRLDMQQAGIDVADEARGGVVLHASIAEAVLGTGEDAVLLNDWGVGVLHDRFLWIRNFPLILSLMLVSIIEKEV